MDFVRLVKNGEYKKEDLDTTQKAYVEGMEFALHLLDYVLEERGDSLMEQLLQEIQESTIEDAKQHIYRSICEQIVAFGDENACKSTEEE